MGLNVEELKTKVLDLAIRGKLVLQDEIEGTAIALMKKIKAEKEILVQEKKIKKQEAFAPVIEDEIPFEIPENWFWTRLGYVTSYGNNRTIEPSNIDSTTWVLELEDIEKGTSIINKYIYNNERLSKSNKNEFKSGNVLYGKLRPYLKKILVAPLDGVCTTEIFPFVGYGGISSHFIVMIMKSTYFDTIVNEETHGMNMPRLGTNTAISIPLPLPPLAEQHRIVQKVEELFTLLDNLNSEVKSSTDLLSMLKNKTLDLAIRGKLVLQDESEGTAHELLRKIKVEKERLVREKKIKKQDALAPITEDEIPFDIPDSWCWTRLGIVSTINPRNHIEDETEVSFVPMRLIKEGYGSSFTYETRKWNAVKSGFTHFAEGDIAVAKITPCFQNRKSVIMKGLKSGYGAGTTEIHIIQTDYNYVDSQYIFILVKCDWFIISGIENFTGTVNQQRISTEFVQNFPFPLPPLAEQHRIVEKVNSIMALIQAMEDDLNRKTDNVMNAIPRKLAESEVD